MESQALRSAVRRLRQVVSVPPAGPDAELVRAFAKRRDAVAFEQIVRRHGPMVLGVCRRVLRDAADADDAFQATFLVLVRKAGSLRQPDRLAGWLHQVAHRVARKARALQINRARREGDVFDVAVGEPPAEIVWRELRPIFDAELDRLPDRLRLPAVLCLLEGNSKAEAARALGWPEGTLSCRLQRARERLRIRLAARGLTLSAAAFAATLFEGAGSASVPDRLIVLTIKSVTTAAGGAAARALADGVTRAMFLAKVKTAAAAVLVFGATGTGLVVVPGSGSGPATAGEPGPGGSAERARAASRAEPVDRERDEVWADHQRTKLAVRLQMLRSEIERDTKLLQSGALPAAESRLTTLREEAAATEDQLKKLGGEPVDDGERLIQRQELQLLKERLAFEEQMVRKGFMTETQVKKTRLEVARAEAELAKAEAPKAPDPRRAVAEDTVRTLETLLQRTEAAYKAGTAGEAEVLNARVRLNEAKLKLLELGDPPPPAAKRPPDLDADIAANRRDLDRAKDLLKRGIMTLEEVNRLREELTRLEAYAARAGDDFAAARKHREAAVVELETRVKNLQALVERKAASRGELRAAEVALAEARVEALKAGVRQQLASIVTSREEELREVRALHELKAVSSEEVRRAELAVTEARARLAAER